ncbi:hypothetical protein ACDQ56_11715 [Fusobacterium animalis]|uniref:hypothetical protein n=1 Tax=Fusobacterium animalis TaxID=76859 RepID=UPI00355867EF
MFLLKIMKQQGTSTKVADTTKKVSQNSNTSNTSNTINEIKAKGWTEKSNTSL